MTLWQGKKGLWKMTGPRHPTYGLPKGKQSGPARSATPRVPGKDCVVTDPEFTGILRRPVSQYQVNVCCLWKRRLICKSGSWQEADRPEVGQRDRRIPEQVPLAPDSAWRLFSQQVMSDPSLSGDTAIISWRLYSWWFVTPRPTESPLWRVLTNTHFPGQSQVIKKSQRHLGYGPNQNSTPKAWWRVSET